MLLRFEIVRHAFRLQATIPLVTKSLFDKIITINNQILHNISVNVKPLVISRFQSAIATLTQPQIGNSSVDVEDSILMSSTMKKRRAKMNKHKLRKRMKKLRKNTKISRS